MDADRQIAQGEVSPAFASKVNKLRQLLATELLARPHSFGNEAIVGGEVLSSLLAGVCKAVNDGLSNFVPLRWVVDVRLLSSLFPWRWFRRHVHTGGGACFLKQVVTPGLYCVKTQRCER